MRQITPSRVLIEKQRNRNVIGRARRLLIEVVSRDCKAIAKGTGSPGSDT